MVIDILALVVLIIAVCISLRSGRQQDKYNRASHLLINMSRARQVFIEVREGFCHPDTENEEECAVSLDIDELARDFDRYTKDVWDEIDRMLAIAEVSFDDKVIKSVRAIKDIKDRYSRYLYTLQHESDEVLAGRGPISLREMQDFLVQGWQQGLKDPFMVKLDGHVEELRNSLGRFIR